MLVRQMLVRQTTVGLSFMFYRAKVMALAHSPRFLNLFQADLTLVHKTIRCDPQSGYFVTLRFTTDFLKSLSSLAHCVWLRALLQPGIGRRSGIKVK